MKVTPIGLFNAQTLPLVEGNIYDISEEELTKLRNHELRWETEEFIDEVDVLDEDGNVVAKEKRKATRPILVENDRSDEIAEGQRQAKLREIAELKKNLSDTDYEAIKYAEGAMTEEEYAPYKTQRAEWRARINELEESL